MRFGGVVSEDAPDPRLGWREQARRMPVPVLGLVPQSHLEDWDAIGVGSSTRNGVVDSYEVSISYTLWRNPDRRDDPVNLAELDDDLRRAVEAEPPRPRPPWLVEQVRRMRYPVLWECVRTRWCRDPGEPDTVGAQLVAHINHILLNEFRRQRVVCEDPPYELDHPVHERCVESGIAVQVDGVVRKGIRIDTDPDVYGVGVELGGSSGGWVGEEGRYGSSGGWVGEEGRYGSSGGWVGEEGRYGSSVLTAAIPRDALPYLVVAFAVRPL